MARAPEPLPIDPLLPEVVATVRAHAAAVIEAPPGAGKTTRVPRALVEAGLAGEVVVLEPRRLPTRLAARRVAEELGERPGDTVGYAVRFEDVSGPRTRLKFVTEGILARRLLADPELRGVGCVVLDEFHERHLATDLALALLRRLQQGRRPDLKVLFTTGYTRNAIIHHGRLDADVELLTKPFTSEALAEKVRQMLDMNSPDPVARVSAVLDNIKNKSQD